MEPALRRVGKWRFLTRGVFAAVLAFCWIARGGWGGTPGPLAPRKTPNSHIQLLEKLVGAAEAAGDATTDVRSTTPPTAVGGVEERLMRMVDAARQTHKPESDSGGSSGGEVTVEKSAEPRLAYVAKKRRPDAKKALLRRQAALTATPALLFTHLIMGKRMQDDILHGPLQRIPSFFERAPDPAGFNKLSAPFVSDVVDGKSPRTPTSFGGIAFKALPTSPGSKLESPTRISASLWNPFDSLEVDGFEPASPSADGQGQGPSREGSGSLSPKNLKSPSFSREVSFVGELPTFSVPWPAGKLDGKVKAREFEDVWGGSRGEAPHGEALYASAPDMLAMTRDAGDLGTGEGDEGSLAKSGRTHPLISAAFSNEAMALSGAALLGLAGAGALRLAKSLRSDGKGSGEIVSANTSVWDLDECILVLDVFDAEATGALKGGFVPHSLSASVNLRQQRLVISYLTQPSFKSAPLRFLMRRRVSQTETIDIPRDECVAFPGAALDVSYLSLTDPRRQHKAAQEAARSSVSLNKKGRLQGKRTNAQKEGLKEKSPAGLSPQFPRVARRDSRRKPFSWKGPVFREYTEMNGESERTVALSFKFKRNPGWLPVAKVEPSVAPDKSKSPIAEEGVAKKPVEKGAGSLPLRKARLKTLGEVAAPSRAFLRGVLSAVEAVEIGLTTEEAPQARRGGTSGSLFSEDSSQTRIDAVFVEVSRRGGFCQWNVALKKPFLEKAAEAVKVFVDLGTQQFKVTTISEKGQPQQPSGLDLLSAATSELPSQRVVDIPEDCYVAFAQDVVFQTFAFLRTDNEEGLSGEPWASLPNPSSPFFAQDRTSSLSSQRTDLLVVGVKAAVFQDSEVQVRDAESLEKEALRREQKKKQKKKAKTELSS